MDAILAGRENTQLEGNEIYKSIHLLDGISKDLAGIIPRHRDGDSIKREEYTTKVLLRYARINGVTAPYGDIYDARKKIYTLDKQIADQGIIPGEYIEGVLSEDMKIRLWAQKSLMEAREYLDSIGMRYLGDGKWDLREMKGNDVWKDKVGGKLLTSFPSSGRNRKWKIGNKYGVLTKGEHIAKMLISVGYMEEDIQRKGK